MTQISTEPDRIGRVVLTVLVAAAAYALILMAQPFANALGWATVIAIVFHPMHQRFETRYGSVRAAWLSTVAVAVVVVVPVLLLTGVFIREGAQAVSVLQRAYAEGRLSWLDRGWEWVQQRSVGGAQVDIGAAVVDGVRQLAGVVAAQGGAIVQNVVLSVIDLVMTLFAAFFFFRDGRALMAFVRRVLPMSPAFRERLISQIGEVVSATVLSAGVVAGLQGLLGGLLFALLGLSAPVFWGVVMAFFCVLPLGAWIVWAPFAIYLVGTGDVVRGAILATAGFAIVSSVDNVLRPALLSGRAQMNGLLVFISLIGGARVFGVLGLVLGPALVAVATGAAYAYADRPSPAAPS